MVVWTDVMSVRGLTPWEFEEAPADTFAVYWAVLGAIQKGRDRAEAEHWATAGDREAAERERAADARQDARQARFFELTAGEEGGDG